MLNFIDKHKESILSICLVANLLVIFIAGISDTFGVIRIVNASVVIYSMIALKST